MHAIGQDLYVIREPEAQSWVPLTFYALADRGEVRALRRPRHPEGRLT
jgi:hypothetical protein